MQRGPKFRVTIVSVAIACSYCLVSAHSSDIGERKGRDLSRSPAPSFVEWSIRPAESWQGDRNESTQIEYIVERAPTGQKGEEKKAPRKLDEIPFVPKEEDSE